MPFISLKLQFKMLCFSFYICFSLTGVPGKPVITGFDDAVEEGGKVTLTCTSSGSKPPAELHWYRDQEEIQGTNTHAVRSGLCSEPKLLLFSN